MKERPILFNAEMVRKILAGKKTQTRRLKGLKEQNEHWRMISFLHKNDGTQYMYLGNGVDEMLECPYGKPGDRLWVRETWKAEELESGLDGIRYKADDAFIAIENSFEAGERWIDARHNKKGQKYKGWRPSIFMPRWASRITLEITEVRIGRLQEISDEDIIAEGTPGIGVYPVNTAMMITGTDNVEDCEKDLRRCVFIESWDSINAKRGFPWDKNPWVWVINFRKI